MWLLRCVMAGRRQRFSIMKASVLLLSVALVSWLLLVSSDVVAKINLSYPPALRYMDNAAYDTLYHQGDGRVNKSLGGLDEGVKGKGGGANANGRLPKGVTVEMQQKLLSSPPLPGGEQSSQVQNSPTGSSHNDHTLSTRQERKERPVEMQTPSLNGPDSLELLRRMLLHRNAEQRILNADKFPAAAHLSAGSVVIIVQVHRREGYLKHLISSLREAREIESVLLIISHDYYYDEIDRIVLGIDFCRVIQIFYPYSLQLYPDTFPGQSKNDCPRNTPRDKALQLNCTNALHPDSFGHYREASVTAIKHHWWWKANMVFDGLRSTANFPGHVVFLEEDHFVSPDFVVVAKLLIALRQRECSDCDFINMGSYPTVKDYRTISNKAVVAVWNSGKHNMGFGMNREVWNKIKSCSKQFCEYDDYNWDWSLNVLSSSCLKRDIRALLLKAPRIYHIGTCGTHQRHACNENAGAEKVQGQLESYRSFLFPTSLILDHDSPGKRRVARNYGGWGDTRDHQLCLSFVH